VQQPSKSALTLVAVSHGIPFVGFGFLDNFIMITAGESIEASLGAALTMSSMCAAGLGNLVSDIAGISLQEVIARHSHRITQEPALTPDQEALPSTQRRGKRRPAPTLPDALGPPTDTPLASAAAQGRGQRGRSLASARGASSGCAPCCLSHPPPPARPRRPVTRPRASCEV